MNTDINIIETVKYDWEHFSSQEEICVYLNKFNITKDRIVSINKDERGNWWLILTYIQTNQTN